MGLGWLKPAIDRRLSVVGELLNRGGVLQKRTHGSPNRRVAVACRPRRNQRFNQMQRRTNVDTQPDNVAGILRNLRLIQDNMHCSAL